MPVANTPENLARHLAKSIVDNGPSYPSPTTLFRFLESAQRHGLVTLHFKLPELPTPLPADFTPNAAS